MNLPDHFTPIASREHLLGMLAEAAEIEHNLMCCYLYAAFSLKQGVDEDLSAHEIEAVQEWRRTIVAVAIEEMAHLTMVANIMSAIGGAPHFGRQNFPVAAGYHPSGVVVKLAPFTPATLDHFIYLERPDGVVIDDGEGFEPSVVYQRGQIAGRIMPSAQDYATVGQLYAAIADGLEKIAGEIGEDALFTGDPARQIGPEIVSLPGILRIRCLRTARRAIDAIVLQGEGSPDGSDTSHYARFLSVRDSYRQLLVQRADFAPARPAATNPLMRRPPIVDDRMWVAASPAAELLDIANAAYNQMLRLLLQAYADTRGVAQQRALADAAIELMFAISPVASELTRHRADPDNNDCNAGMSFATLRATSTLPIGPATDAILVERIREIAAAATAHAGTAPMLADVATRLKAVADRLKSDLAQQDVAAEQAPSNPAVLEAATPVPIVDGAIERIEGRALTLLFEAKRCIHARHCVLGQPAVFKANVEGPWIDPDATSTEALVTVAHMCPSGAIRYTRKDGGEEEQPPLVNLVQIRENGPLGLRGALTVDGITIGMRATLCRCGASHNKPYCDGSHHDIAFAASGEPETRASEPLEVRNGTVDIRPQKDGPLVVRGNLEICTGTGRTIDRLQSARLCRCGHSADKPFCDGSHARVGFVS